MSCNMRQGSSGTSVWWVVKTDRQDAYLVYPGFAAPFGSLPSKTERKRARTDKEEGGGGGRSEETGRRALGSGLSG